MKHRIEEAIMDGVGIAMGVVFLVAMCVYAVIGGLYMTVQHWMGGACTDPYCKTHHPELVP